MEKRLTWDALERAIRAKGLTPSEFAKAAGVSTLSIGMVKAGKPIPFRSEVKLMKEIYGEGWNEAPDG